MLKPNLEIQVLFLKTEILEQDVPVYIVISVAPGKSENKDHSKELKS
jgi:hypothetical protein